MRKVSTTIAALVILLIIVSGVVLHFRSQPDESSSGTDAAPGVVQPEWCPAVQVLAAPGTWESAADDDPYNPQANPNSFMLSITRPLQQAYPGGEVEVWTLPYPAEFRNVNGGMEQLGYDDSRDQGINRTFAELNTKHSLCPLTRFVLTGFSQGAVIMGDIASEIGNGRTNIAPDAIMGVALVSDGRRQPGEGITPDGAIELPGVGAEIALHPLNALVRAVVPGATMRGIRAGGFGSLNDSTVQICAPNDTICDAPPSVTDALARVDALLDANGVHAMYASNPAVIPGTTTDQWVVQWAQNLIAEQLASQ
ncbi:cutinase family protein [Corynebacterium caspium]|uniref:cutinase family protein n=1 Tax=Corynebacterium caspium TaxID=234828 RepID=UPI0003824698|nr:cutinase family protein [Corynebacterium caspium]WKD59981.1 Cutinase [Corynebacterium caspium DSM 44850]